MRKLMNFLRGMVILRLTGPFPERLINLCAQEGIDFWAMEWLDEHTVRFTTRRYTLGRLAELAERAGCEVERESSRGLPDFLGRFRTRYREAFTKYSLSLLPALRTNPYHNQSYFESHI